ncbi:MAG: hypothetical protein MHMPM18_001797 [Marteilia pararefringens]
MANVEEAAAAAAATTDDNATTIGAAPSIDLEAKKSSELRMALEQMGYDVPREEELCQSPRLYAIIKSLYNDLCDSLIYIADGEQQVAASATTNSHLDDDKNNERKKKQEEEVEEIECLKREHEKAMKAKSLAVDDMQFLKEKLLVKIEDLERDLREKNQFIHEQLWPKDAYKTDDAALSRNFLYTKDLPDKIQLQTRQALHLTSNVAFNHPTPELQKSSGGIDSNKSDSIEQQNNVILENRIVKLNETLIERDKIIEKNEADISVLKSKLDFNAETKQQEMNHSENHSCRNCREFYEAKISELQRKIETFRNENEYLLYELERVNQTRTNDSHQSSNNAQIKTKESYTEDNVEKPGNNNYTNGQLAAQKRLLTKEIEHLRRTGGKDGHRECLTLISELRETLISKINYASDVESKYMSLLQDFECFKKNSIAEVSKAVQTDTRKPIGLDKELQCDSVVSQQEARDQSTETMPLNDQSDSAKLCESCMKYLKEIEIIRNENFLYESQLESKKAQFDELKNDHESRLGTLKDLRQQLQEYEAKGQLQEDKNKSLNCSIAKLQAQIKALTCSLRQIERDYEQITVERQRIFEKYQTSESDRNILSQQVDSKTSLILNLRSDCLRFQNSVENLESDLSEVRNENIEMKANISELIAELESKNVTIKQYEADIDRMKSELNASGEELANKTKSLEDLTIKCTNLENQTEETNSKFSLAMQHQNMMIEESNSLKMQVSDLECSLGHKKSQCTDLEAELDKARADARDRVAELQRFRHQIEEMRDIIKCNAETIVKWKTKFEDSEKKNEDENKQLTKRLLELEKERDILKGDLKACQGKISELTVDLDHRLNMIEGLKRLLNQNYEQQQLDQFPHKLRDQKQVENKDDWEKHFKLQYEHLLSQFGAQRDDAIDLSYNN